LAVIRRRDNACTQLRHSATPFTDCYLTALIPAEAKEENVDPVATDITFQLLSKYILMPLGAHDDPVAYLATLDDTRELTGKFRADGGESVVTLSKKIDPVSGEGAPDSVSLSVHP